MTSHETSHTERGKMPAIAIWMVVTSILILGLSLLLMKTKRSTKIPRNFLTRDERNKLAPTDSLVRPIVHIFS